MNKWITCAAVAALFLSLNIAHAVSCNPKAQVHQQRLANIQTAVRVGQIPSADDEQFVLCMLPEKEDQQAFQQQVQQNRIQEQARQRQEVEQRRQAAVWREQQEARSRAALELERQTKQNQERRRAEIRKPRLIIAPVGQWSDEFHFAEYSCWSAAGEVPNRILDSVDIQIERVGWSGKLEWMDRKHADEHVTGVRFRSKTGKPESLIVMSGAGLGDQKCLMDDNLRAAYTAR